MKSKTKFSLLGLAITSMVLIGCKKGPEAQTPAGEDVTVTKTEAADIYIPAQVADRITDIKLNKRIFNLFCNTKTGSEKNEDTTLVATVYPKKAGDRNLKWSSSDPTVATVDENGKVTTVGEGEATITVSNQDGTVKDTARVIVNDMKDQRLANVKDRMTNILKAQKDPDFKLPDTISEYESFKNVVTKNGKPISSNIFTQSITASEKNAYLDLEVDSQETRVEDGSPVPEKIRYTFYTTEQFETFLFKSSGKVKNYMSINQSGFMGKDKIEALKAVCDQFFVSGSKILTGVKEDALSNVSADWIESADYNPHFARVKDNAGQVAFDLKEGGQQTADQEDEDDNGIPVGTKYMIDIYVRFYFENNLLTAKHIDQSYTYKIGNDNYVSSFEIDYWYETNSEIVYPDKANYQLVDGAFDL